MMTVAEAGSRQGPRWKLLRAPVQRSIHHPDQGKEVAEVGRPRTRAISSVWTHGELLFSQRDFNFQDEFVDFDATVAVTIAGTTRTGFRHQWC